MTWYATEILAECNPSLLDAVKSDPGLSAHAYLIGETIDFVLNDSEYTFNPPSGGLLVIRPVCDLNEHCADWHDEPVMSWHSLSGPSSVKAIPPQAFASHAGDGMLNEFPPSAFFAYLKQLSASTKARLAFFYCFMWGGDTEVEYTWLFGEREEAAMVLQSGVKSKVARVDAHGHTELQEVDLLSETLSYLGAPIPSPFWVPHTRGFPWEHYKLLPGASRGA
jgi:hypothetical protein